MSANPDLDAIRRAIASFALSARVEPNQSIAADQAFLPGGHRGVLDFRRQLVVGNRGMGKSFWTHALLSEELRPRLAAAYGHTQLQSAQVEVGFNGSDKVGRFAPTIGDISRLQSSGCSADAIWRAVLLSIAQTSSNNSPPIDLDRAVNLISSDPSAYSRALSQLDDELLRKKKSLLVVFDALDRLGRGWAEIQTLTRSLLGLTVGLQSFGAIRAKVFMRTDQFSDPELFRFPDSSKVRNDHVQLIWKPNELYGLLLFEALRDPVAGTALVELAEGLGAAKALPMSGADEAAHIEEQARLVEAIAGEYMGSNKKRGRVYTWVPLHLSDAANNCSPRTFLTAWKKAAEHVPPPSDRVIDHLGLLDGVRSASTSRLTELYEDYPWIKPALASLRRQFVPMDRDQLLLLWKMDGVLETIGRASADVPTNAPVGLHGGDQLAALLEAMKSVAVMEERSNRKINVPDIYRVEAEILRKGGVAVPTRRT